MSQLTVNLFDMVACVSRALDLLHPAVQDHHFRVAVVASRLSRALGLPEPARLDLVIAGALHDAAAVLEQMRLATADFAFDEPGPNARVDDACVHGHAEEGARLLGQFSPFTRAARLIEHHHVAWDGGRGQSRGGRAVPLESHLLHLADRIAVLPVRANVLEQRKTIVERIRAEAGRSFHPEHVAAFEAVASRESFWLDLVFDAPGAFAEETRTSPSAALGVPELLELAAVLGALIDSRSPFTATHSAGVSAVAEALAARLGMDATLCQHMRVAGLLHDLGKLAVPSELLDKPGRLLPAELGVVQTHAYHTLQILKPVACLSTIATWAAFHHERLDGRGYPFRPVSLPLGSRIVAVADMFTALSEDRPYRPGMHRDQVTTLLDDGVAQGALDGDVVQTLYRHREAMERVRSGPLAPPMAVATTKPPKSPQHISREEHP
jgi:HD-GYP domain-containing protein (c-di-GMP phosphodiesterase class II)